MSTYNPVGRISRAMHDLRPFFKLDRRDFEAFMQARKILRVMISRYRLSDLRKRGNKYFTITINI